jgi:hypothetical protein
MFPSIKPAEEEIIVNFSRKEVLLFNKKFVFLRHAEF